MFARKTIIQPVIPPMNGGIDSKEARAFGLFRGRNYYGIEVAGWTASMNGRRWLVPDESRQRRSFSLSFLALSRSWRLYYCRSGIIGKETGDSAIPRDRVCFVLPLLPLGLYHRLHSGSADAIASFEARFPFAAMELKLVASATSTRGSNQGSLPLSFSGINTV